MFNIVNRVFFKELMLSVFAVLFVFLLLFFTIDVLNEAHLVGNNDYRLTTLFRVVSLNQPEYIYQLLPICALIGSVLAFSSMVARSELVVWRVSGVGFWHFVCIVAFSGAVLAILLWLIGEQGIVRANLASSEIRKEALHQSGFFRKDNGGGFWSKQNLDNGSFRMINIASLKDGDILLNVRLFDLSPSFALTRIMEAKTAKPQGKSGEWILNDVRQVVLVNDDRGLVLDRKETHLDSLPVDLAENNIDVIRNYNQDMVYMTMRQLTERIKTLSATGQNARPFKVAYWQKIFYPMSAIVMMFLALPFAFMQTRKGGIGLRVFIGIMLGLSFFILTAVMQFLGPLVKWSPIFLAGAPNILFLIIAMIWINRVTRV